MKTLNDYINFFGNSAYLYFNGYINKWQYFIPITDYDEVLIDSSFGQDTATILVKDKTVVCSIKSLMGRDFLTGDSHIFIVPIQYDDRPKLDVFTKDNTEDDLFDSETSEGTTEETA